MARLDGRAPTSSTRDAHDDRVAGSHRRRGRMDPRSWAVSALLVLLGAGVLLLGRGKDCLDLSNEGMTSGPTQVCSTTIAPGAVVFALICFATALFVWFVQRRD